MEEYSVGIFANRGEAIPVLNVAGSDEGPLGLSSDEEHDKHGQLESVATPGSVRDGAGPTTTPQAHKRNPSLQDRLFAKFVRCHHEIQRLQKREAGNCKVGD